MRALSLVITGCLVLSTAAQAQPLHKKLLMRWQQNRVLNKVAGSRYVSNDVKQDVAKTRDAMSTLRSKATRVETSAGRNASGTYQNQARFFNGATLLGSVTYSRNSSSQRKVTVTTQSGNRSQTHEIFTTGRGTRQLLLGELRKGLTGQKKWNLVLNQIRGEMKNGSYTAGSRMVEVSDIGRSDLTTNTHRVERWRARGTGAPSNAQLPATGVQARAGGKIVLGSLRTRQSQYRLEGGQRVPHPDPEAGGKPIRDTLFSTHMPYHVAPNGAAVFSANAQ